jgi:hypothetical protein
MEDIILIVTSDHSTKVFQILKTKKLKIKFLLQSGVMWQPIFHN